MWSAESSVGQNLGFQLSFETMHLKLESIMKPKFDGQLLKLWIQSV